MNGWVVLATAAHMLLFGLDKVSSLSSPNINLSPITLTGVSPVAGIPGFVPGLLPERVPFSFPNMGFSLPQLISFWILCLRSTNFRVF